MGREEEEGRGGRRGGREREGKGSSEKQREAWRKQKGCVRETKGERVRVREGGRRGGKE